MSKKRMDQLLAGYADGDAISNMAARLRKIFRDWGHPAEIFADPSCVSPPLRADCRPLAEYQGAASDICIHHYGIASPAAELFAGARAQRVLVYHNITPSDFFRGYDDGMCAQLTAARAQLTAAARGAAVWTVSRFNALELTAAGIADVRILPLPFTPPASDIVPDPLIIEKFGGSPESRKLKNILFVGRIAPNKRVEDLIEAFAWYHKAINPFSRLLIVGSNRSAPRYYTMLRMLAGDLDLPNACFEGFANDAGLAAYYHTADLYVCPSAHEGYCLPLLEAMHYNVPALARRAGGMPEAMDGAGVMYDDLTAPELAELMRRMLEDRALRAEALESQRARMQREYTRDLDNETRNLLREWI